jgi:hypothetical protein
MRISRKRNSSIEFVSQKVVAGFGLAIEIPKGMAQSMKVVARAVPTFGAMNYSKAQFQMASWFFMRAITHPAAIQRTGTAKENTADCISRGRFKKSAGTFNSLAKLTDTDIVEIRNSTLSHRDLSLKYGIDRTNIHYICNGETWKHVPMPEIKSRKADGRAKLTPDQAISIRSAAQEISHGALASEYGVSVPLVCMIRKGRAWKNLAASIEDNVNGN